eukprot:5768446-Amphidinium_carterae.1
MQAMQTSIPHCFAVVPCLLTFSPHSSHEQHLQKSSKHIAVVERESTLFVFSSPCVPTWVEKHQGVGGLARVAFRRTAMGQDLSHA